MNSLERQMRIGRELFELNTRTMQKLGEITMEDLTRYADAGRQMGERLRDVKDPQSYLTLQREYFENLWNNAQASMQARNELIRQSVAEAGALIQGDADADTDPGTGA